MCEFCQRTVQIFSERGTMARENIGTAQQSPNAGKTHASELSSHQETALAGIIARAVAGFDAVDPEIIMQESMKNTFEGITDHEMQDALILGTVACIERDPAYGYVAARFLLGKLYHEVLEVYSEVTPEKQYGHAFICGIERGVVEGIIDERLLTYDLAYLANHLDPSRDNLFDYMGLRTLYERYFLKHAKKRFELPQAFWMRIAMGLALNEPAKNERALEFYYVLSAMDYVPSTPTLLHAGLTRPQLSSCFLTTISDDLPHIFKCLGDNAQLSKWSGGVANDWTPLRATGSPIKSIKAESQGVIPFLKIANDVTAAISRSGSRRGATCAYLETWHLDIEDFIDLRKNTGDERRRTHDMNTANWIPDLFMKRVMEDKVWTLFSPDEVPDLHDLYGKAFEERYAYYESQARAGQIAMYKEVPAQQLWKKMLSRLFETGHPWITFKDSFNVRSPQDHAGVIHSTNLCTEIGLNTSKDETAVCNLGSINLANHVVHGVFDDEKLAHTVSVAMRMLDNVIDINFYPTGEAHAANLRHRPVGLGIMGFQDALYQLDIAFDDQDAFNFADASMEKVAYHAILSSSKLAKERGSYSSYSGSKWDRGIFPQDTLDLLEQERGVSIDVRRGGSLDWTPVRKHVRAYGMRNSNTMAIAPTATISTIAGCYPCIEPIYKNLYVKSNMNGEFTMVNKYLVEDLKMLGLWNGDMLDQLKFADGSVQSIPGVPQELRNKYKEGFELDPLWLIGISAVRGKWIDQSQSHNVLMKGVSGKMLDDIYRTAWKLGLKATYYLRTLGASQIEKATLDAKFGFTQKRDAQSMAVQAAMPLAGQPSADRPAADKPSGPAYRPSSETPIAYAEECTETLMIACSISTDPECEVCQ